LYGFVFQLKESEEKAKLLVEERDHLLTERDSALQEAQMWRSELGKARGNAVILEAAVVRAEEKARVSAADADMRVKEAMSRLQSAIREKEDLLALVDALQLQIKRFSIHNFNFFCFHSVESISKLDPSKTNLMDN
jgi:hypothetical protein